MRLHNFNSLIHVEGDNLLYGPLGGRVIPDLLKG